LKTVAGRVSKLALSVLADLVISGSFSQRRSVWTEWWASREAHQKHADVLKLGAHEYIATSDEENWSGKHAGTLDLIVCTISSPNMPLSDYLKLLDTKGRFSCADSRNADACRREESQTVGRGTADG